MNLGVMVILLSFFGMLIGMEGSSPGTTGDIIRATAMVTYSVRKDVLAQLCARIVTVGYTQGCK